MKPIRTLTATALLAAVTLALAAPAPARAANAATGTGIGFVLGGPSGLSLKIPQDRANALQFTLGYDLDGRGNWNGPGYDHDHDHSSVHLGGDYLWYNYSLIQVPKGRLPLYYGPGLFFGVHNHSGGDAHARFGIRGVIGLEYQMLLFIPSRAPFDLFFELGPGISVFPDTYGTVFSGLGGRFFF